MVPSAANTLSRITLILTLFVMGTEVSFGQVREEGSLVDSAEPEAPDGMPIGIAKPPGFAKYEKTVCGESFVEAVKSCESKYQGMTAFYFNETICMKRSYGRFKECIGTLSCEEKSQLWRYQCDEKIARPQPDPSPFLISLSCLGELPRELACSP